MLSKIIEFMRKQVYQYDKKNNLLDDSTNLYICTRFDTRNRYKNDKYKIPSDKPQCPIFNDNRCCGGCNLAPKCDHCVNCGCFGFTYARMGGNDKNYYLHKASDNYGIGRLDKEGKFDWDYYKLNTFLDNAKDKKFIIVTIENEQYAAEIKSKIKRDGRLKCFIPDLNYYKNITIKDVYNIYSTYESYEKAKSSIF